MAVPVDTDTDLVILEELDFDVPLVCENPECTSPARWVQRFTCCGRSYLKCEPCRKAWVEQWNALVAITRTARCAYCGTRAPHWRDLVEFIPIEAR